MQSDAFVHPEDGRLWREVALFRLNVELNLIERRWRYIKRGTLYGRDHPAFAEFQAAINEVIAGLSTTHTKGLESLMTLNIRRFEDVSLNGWPRKG